ncbi:putative ATP-dependent RNA helicase [Phytophthora cactorum]|uniref:ATP-dependent RNA helicase n=2 Tax=Phytophthora cactorum TaxID=29920 RepID=A0A329SVR6_9STRA|nr:putative ATP-dependent RNA helicase [Phytophthora cactorum]KAG2847690.1 putative ATP-dependent RNA helicase [Phytophthora cactorum]KAG2848083.1 putative ATP-dependent RNA helicase [Phytophthora cactorum]KAG2933655.1 putative ATP-dependent RNA helicase [Phytophthora cactorum]KAG2943571.1 putative ATP-dependent RNA helicase [Phytophthora cactorum]
MDGFSLNISASSGTRKPTKKKNTFRAKQQAKRAKAKTNKTGQVPQKPHDKQLGGQSHDHRPRTVGNGHNHHTPVTNNPLPKVEALKVEVTAAEPEEPVEVVPAQHEEPAAESAKEEDALKEETEELKGKEANGEGDDEAEAAEPMEVQPKTFGTRRNPNKEGYNVEKFTQPRVKIDNVLSKPLTSSSSEKIFAANTFKSMQMTEKLVNVLKKDVESGGFGFARPTNVQVQTIPSVLKGNDILVKSETGSGKTLSYLLPIVQKLQAVSPRIQRRDGCMALVLAPTRELCTQILETAHRLIQPFVFLVPGAIIGGEKKKAEKARLRKGISILIATPGRLADHLVNTCAFNYSRLQFLVLDEADRLLDMGFEKQITQILTILDGKRTPQKRQNILVSATINSGVQQLAKMSLSNPVLIDADAVTSGEKLPSDIKPATGSQEKFSTPHQLMQHFMLVPAKARLCALTCFLREELRHAPRDIKKDGGPGKCKIVVFLSTCDAVDFHYALFRKCAWPSGKGSSEEAESSGDNGVASLFGSQGPVFRLHGNIPQQERVTTFKSFCTSSSGVLLCTDVAARGLNLPTVKWIVQYDPPTETRDYVHRVGRTARSGNQGSSLLFLMPSESEYLDYLSKQGLKLNALSLEKTVSRVGKHGGFLTTSRKKLLHEVVQGDLQFLYEQTLLADKELFELACQAFHSFVRSYATHSSDTRNIFHVRSLHFGHVAKSFALRDPPASAKLRDTGRNAKKGTLHKRKERDDKQQAVVAKKQKKMRDLKRRYAQNVSEFAG